MLVLSIKYAENFNICKSKEFITLHIVSNFNIYACTYDTNKVDTRY